MRINEFGLCEVAAKGRHFAFTLDKLSGYAGQPLRDVGLEIGVEVDFESDENDRIASASLPEVGLARRHGLRHRFAIERY